MSASGVSIFRYTSAREFLCDAFSGLQNKKPELTARKFARDVGMKSHALLILLLQGKRPIRLQHVPMLAQGLQLTSEERLFFQALIQFESAQTPEERELCSLWLADLHPGTDFRITEVEDYRLVSHWVHTAILAMTDLAGFTGTTQEASARLGGRATIYEVEAAISRLVEKGLLIRDTDGRLRATTHEFTTKDDVASAGVREYHKRTIDLARESVASETVDLREFQSFSVAIRKEQIPFAKEMIRKFRAQFYQALRSENADEVYQMNLHFFRLTESRPDSAHVESGQDEGTERGSSLPDNEVMK